MSKTTEYLGLHIWEIPKDNDETFDYVKSIGDNFEKVEKGLKDAVDKFTEPLSYKGEVENVSDLPTDNVKNGDIYNVTSESKNYIYNGTDWVEYCSTLNLEYLENNTKTTKTTEVSTELTIEDSAEAGAKLNIANGKSEQETRSGKNLLELIDGTYTNNGITAVVENGIITLNGTAIGISFISINLKNSFNLVTGNSYYLSAFNESIIGDNNNLCGVRLNQDGTKQTNFDKVNSYALFGGNILISYVTIRTSSGMSYDNFVIKPQLETGKKTDTFEQGGISPSMGYPSKIRNVGDNVNLFNKDNANILENIGIGGNQSLFSRNDMRIIIIDIKRLKDITISFTKTDTSSIYLAFSNEVPISTSSTIYNSEFLTDKISNVVKTIKNNNYRYLLISTTKTFNYEKLKVEEGEVATPWTLYNCGSVNFKVENKNKFDLKKWFEAVNPNACTKTLLKNGTRLNFNAGADAFLGFVGSIGAILSDVYRRQLIEVKAITKYTIQMSSMPKCFLGFFDENYVGLGYYTIPSNYNKSSYVFTTPTGTKYMSVRVGISNNNYTSYDFTDIQLEEGEETNYVEHKEQNISFTMQEGQVLHETDYLANDGIHHKRKTITLKGTEDIKFYNISSTNANRYRFQIEYITDIESQTKYADKVLVLCSHFKGTTFNNRNNEINNIFGNCSGIQKSISMDVSEYKTLAEFKAFLAEQYEAGTPVTIEYELETEQITPYNEQQKEEYFKLQHLLMYEGYNRITCIDEIKPDVQLTYYLNNQINNTYAKRIDSLEDNVNSNKWRLLQEITGNSVISLPADLSELLVYVKGSNNENMYAQINIIKELLSDTTRGFNTGYYNGVNSSFSARVLVSKTKLNLASAYVNATDVTASTKTYVYYKAVSE